MQKDLRLFAAGLLTALPLAGWAFGGLQQELPATLQQRVLSTKSEQVRSLDAQRLPSAARHLMQYQPSAISKLAKGYEMVGLKQERNLGHVHAPMAVPTTMYGRMSYDSEGLIEQDAVCSITLPDVTLTQVGKPSIPFSGGYAQDGTFNTVYVDLSYSIYGYYYYYAVKYDLETFDIVSSETLTSTGFEWFANALTSHPDGGGFGIFLNSSGSGNVYCRYDVDAQTRTEIAPCNVSVVSLSCDGIYVYALGFDNNLYKIDPNTGEETMVGEISLPYTSNGQAYGQSFAIDPKTKNAYWAEFDTPAASSGLYQLDLNDASTTLIADWGLKEIFGLFIPAPAYLDAAPGMATDLKADFADASLTGTISFNAPVLCFDGETALDGDLTYVLNVNGEEVATGTVAPGALVSKELTVAEGMADVAVVMSNASGNGPKAKTSFYAGYDTTEAPANVTLTVSDDNHATLTWDAPTVTLHNGYMGALTYNVWRKVGTESTIVAEGQTETSYNEQLTVGSLASYSYLVEAVNGTHTSAAAGSNGIVLGSSLQCPVELKIDAPEVFALFSVVDANNDGSTWSYNAGSQCARYSYNKNNNGDDWLFTPQIDMVEGGIYTIELNISSYSSYFKERYEVTIGQGANAEAQTTVLIEPQDVPYYNGNPETQEVTFVAPAAGKYNVGIHAISDADSYFIDLYRVAVRAVATAESPEAVVFSVIPGEKGALNAMLTIEAPAQCISGTSLSAIDKMVVSRDGGIIAELTEVVPGQTYTIDEPELSQGLHKWNVVAYVGESSSPISEVSAFIGKDKPADINNAVIADHMTTVTVSWPAVEVGANGGYVDPAEIVYSLYTINDGYLGSLLLETTETSVTLEENTNEGEAGLLQYAIRATNSMGEGTLRPTLPLLVGAPAALPLTETLPAYTVDNYWWAEVVGTTSWGLTTSISANGDNGAALWTAAAAAEEASFNSKKLSFAGTHNVLVNCALYATTADMVMNIEAVTYDGRVTVAKTIDFADAPVAQWIYVNAMLPAELADEPYVVVKFHAVAGAANATVALDDIKMRDVMNHNITLTMGAPTAVAKGSTANVSVTVTNNGADTVENIPVTLTAGQEEFTQTISSLAVFESVALIFNVETTIFDEAETLDLEAQAPYAADEYADDNTASATIQLLTSKAAPVEDLVAEAEDGTVTLTWNATEATVTEVTEDFESYDAPVAFPCTPVSQETHEFTTEVVTEGSLGEWTAYDLDGGRTYTWDNASINWPFVNYGMGYALFNAEDVFGGVTSDFSQYVFSGMQGLLCINSVPRNGVTHNDDWLISPELPGVAQTLRFMANELTTQYGPETLEVLYSTTDKQVESFQLLESFQVATADWMEISAELPEGTRYFAIRCTSADVFGLLIDDITYTTGASAPIAFNVYRNRKLLATVEQTSYVDATAGAEAYTYAVTALYANGTESVPVCVTVGTTTGIDVLTEQAGVKAYTIYGLPAKQMTDGLYIANGQKLMIK